MPFRKPRLLGIALIVFVSISLLLAIQRAREQAVADSISYLKRVGIVAHGAEIACLKNPIQFFATRRLFEVRKGFETDVGSSESIRVEPLEQDRWSVLDQMLRQEGVFPERIQRAIVIRDVDRGLRLMMAWDGTGRAWIWWQPDS